MESLNKETQDTLTNAVKGSKTEEIESEGEFDCNFEYEEDKEKIVEHSPRGRFIRFNEELGTGAFKTVYKAYDNDSGCEVAWNVIKLHKLPASTFQYLPRINVPGPSEESKRILDEINLLKSLKHANIISFISAWLNKPKEEVVFITEIVSGGSLKNYLKKIKSPRLKVIKSWCREILLALEYLHVMTPNPIIHRDLKCENIFINSNKGEILIGDLGLATHMSTTFANSVIGTPHFMAPEMYEEEYDTAVDIYAFGMCLLEMVTLQIPYKECENPAQVFKKVMSGKKPQSIELIQNEDVKNFILECLKDKDERPTAAELLQSKFLTKPDEADNFTVKLLDGSPVKKNEDQSFSTAASKPGKDGFLAVKAGDLEQNQVSSQEDEKLELQKKISEGKNKQPTIEKLVFEQNNELSPNPSILKEELGASPNKHRDKLYKTGEDDSALSYELSIKSTVKSYIYIIVKIKNHDQKFFNEKLIQIDRRMFTPEALTSLIMKEFQIKTVSPRFNQAILAFMENSELAISATALRKQNYSNHTANTSHSTMNLNATSKIYEQGNQFTEKGTSEISNANNTFFFQSESFLSYYMQYLNSLPRDYFSYETEDSMALRQNAELIELQKAHLIQKKSLLDRRQANLNNLVSIPGFPDDFIPKDYDETQKVRSPNGVDPMLLSPISSGHMSADDVIVNDEINCFCQNNSTEIMSMIGKFNFQNNSLCEECNKSSLLLATGEISQHSGAINYANTPANSGMHEAINSLLQAQVQTSGFNPSSQYNTRLTPMISPKGTTEINFQPFGSQPKRGHQQNKSQKQEFSPVIIEHQLLSRRAQESALSHNTHNINLVQPQERNNKPETPQSLFTGLQEYQKNMDRKSNERAKVQKQSSLEPVKCIDAQESESQQAKNERLGLKRGNSQNASGFAKQNSLPLSKAVWSESGHYISNSKQKDPNVQDSPDGVRIVFSPNITTQQKAAIRSSNFLTEIPIKNSASEDHQSDSRETSQVNPNATISSGLASKPSNPTGTSPSFPEKKPTLTINLIESCRSESNSPATNLVNSKLTSPKQSPPILANLPKPDSQNDKPSTKDNFATIDTEEGTGNHSFLLQKSPREQLRCRDSKLDSLADRILKHSIQGELKRGGTNMNEEDILLVQKCLEIITNTMLETNGIFGHYTEKVLKCYQEKHNLPADGVVTEQLWERMKEDLEKRLKTTLNDKAREIQEIAHKASEDKKTLKEKQIKDAQESLYRIEAELIDLSKL